MRSVTIYTSPFCGFCVRAKRLLDEKGVEYEDINVFFNASRKQEMIERAAGRHTVPQIFVGDDHVGGCDDLFALEAAGRLDAVLTGTDKGADRSAQA